MKKFLIASMFMAAALIFTTPSQAQVIVIANNSVNATSVSKGNLRDIFTGNATSLASSNVTPVLLKAGAAEQEFLKSYIGKSDSAFRAGWRSLVFSGQASMPRSLDSDAAMVAYVSSNPGAIGFISKSTPHPGVKVLAVR